MEKTDISNNSVENKSIPAVPPYAWVILVVVFLASVAAPLNQTKVSPLLSVIKEDLNMSLGLSGWLNSVFAFTGLILALPTGIFLKRFGPKIMGIIALSCLAVGAILGAVSNSAGLLIFSRVIEGNGLGLISVVGPAVVAMWFPPEKRGIPMGIWATWFPVGALTMYLFAPMMAESFGWQFVWWFGAGFAILALVLYIIFMRMPPGMERTAQQKTQSSILSELVSTIKLLNNRQIWMLGIGFGLFTLPGMAIGTFYPTFLREVRGYSLSQASIISSIGIFVVIFSAPRRATSTATISIPRSIA